MFAKKIKFVFSIITILNGTLLAQSTIVDLVSVNQKIDSFLVNLHNKDAAKQMVLERPKNSGITFDILVIHVSPDSVHRLLERFPKNFLLPKIFQLLNDPERDWYANLLLYDISKAYTFYMFKINSREEWLSIDPETNLTYKQEDIAIWKRYEAGIIPPSIWDRK
jgi:hypothetical protein